MSPRARLGSGPDARARLAQLLTEGGHQWPSTTPGVLGRGRDYERVVEGLSQALRSMYAPEHTAELRSWTFPAVLSRSTFERSDYLESFPQLTGLLHTFEGNDGDHARMLASRESGQDWAAFLEPSEMTMTPATCHNIYPRLEGELERPIRFDVVGQCFRHEPSSDPMRMVTFRIHEAVYVGDPDGALEHRDEWLKKYVELLKRCGLTVSVDVANDPFFGRAGRMLASGQREEALKFEVLNHVYDDTPTALASGNAHRDHFGVNFGIELADGVPAHSACAGVGLERTANALLVQHGMAVDAWPDEVQDALGLR